MAPFSVRRLLRSTSADYANLFDARWYQRGQTTPAKGALDHYRRDGWREGRTPNPLFNPDWYLERYPDVAATGVEPLLHFARFGWRERRDPGPAFSTAWYVGEYPDVEQTKVNPLVHFLEHGRKEGRRPHPLLKSLNYAEPAAAIIVVSFNAPDVLALTLESLARSRNVTPFKVFLVENGSADAVKTQVRALAAGYDQGRLDIDLIDLPQNRGFSGGNNVGMAEALKGDCTHICLLNSDVVVTTGWLDRLIETGEPVVGPVSNSVGNEQTVPIDYVVEKTPDAFDKVEEFSQRWARSWRRRVVRSDFLGFFCVLLRRDVIEEIGLLDERFFPGSYEDDDYCLRLVERGYQLAVARHIFMHHWGSASFELLPIDQRMQIGEENRIRFEAKHQRAWSDRSHLLARSWGQDQARTPDHLHGAELRHATLTRHLEVNEGVVRSLADAVRHYQAERVRLKSANAALSLRLEEFLGPQAHDDVVSSAPIAFADKPAPLAAMPARVRQSYDELLSAFWGALREQRSVVFSDLVGVQPILARLAEACAAGRPILVLANGDPVTAPLSDGYFQRVRAIDQLMDGTSRIYVCFDETRGPPRLTPVAQEVWRLDIADEDPIAEALLDAVLAQTAQIYVHSVIRLGAASARKMVKTRRASAVLDLHGALPEEFRLYDDPFGAQVYGRHEREAFQRFDRFVCVSNQMALHYAKKYGLDLDKTIQCPIFSEPPPVASKPRSYSSRPRVVYAGGTARWQKIPEMLDLIAQTSAVYDFTILSPGVAEITEGLAARKVNPGLKGITIRSVEPDQVWAVYQRSDFGLLLRDDCTVNRVACPTKLVEYIAAGVIPVLDSADIGDFLAAGLHYVPVEDFRAMRIPDPDQRRAMAAHNRQLFARMTAQAERAQAQIVQALGLAAHPVPQMVSNGY